MASQKEIGISPELKKGVANPDLVSALYSQSDLMLIGKITFDGTHAPTNTFNFCNRHPVCFRVTICIVLHRLVLAARTANSFPNSVFDFIVNS